MSRHSSCHASQSRWDHLQDHGWTRQKPGYGTTSASTDIRPVTWGTSGYGPLHFPEHTAPRSMGGSWVGRAASGPRESEAGARSRSCFRAHTQWICYWGHQQAWVLLGPLVDKTVDNRGWSWVHSGVRMHPGPRLAPVSANRSATWVWDCLLSLGFHWGFATSYLDPKVLKRTLVFMDGCQIVSMREWGLGISYPIILLTSIHTYNFKYCSMLILTC